MTYKKTTTLTKVILLIMMLVLFQQILCGCTTVHITVNQNQIQVDSCGVIEVLPPYKQKR
jgi:hypothetical protein